MDTSRAAAWRVGNRTGRTLGLAFVALLACALAALLVLPVAGAGGGAEDLRELYVRDVIAAKSLGSDLVVLQGVDDPILVPLFVPPDDGQAIRAAQRGDGASAGLVSQTVAGFGARIRAVVLRQGEGSLEGLLIVERRGEQLPIEISPGAAIAAALTAGQPILTTPQAIEATGLDDEDLRRMVQEEAQAETRRDEQPALRL